MSRYKDALYPDKANDFIDNEGNFKGEAVGSVIPLIEDPLEDNLSTEIKVVSLNEEPGIRYKGYVYAIGLRYFPMEFELTHCTLSIEQPISMKETQDLEFYIIPDEGYDFDPEGFYVEGIDEYTYNYETGYVKLENPLGPVFVGCMCSKMVNVHYNLHNIELNPMPTKIRQNAFQTRLTATATGGSNYRVSPTFTSAVGATVNLRLNQLTISNITAENDIYISMEAARKITAEADITNGSCTFNPSTLWTDQTGGGRIIPTNGYGYPESVTSTGFFNFNYNDTTGYFTYSQPIPFEGDIVTITAECPRLYPIISSTEHVVTNERNPQMRANDRKIVNLKGEDKHYKKINITDVVGAVSWTPGQWSEQVIITGVAEGYNQVEVSSSYTYAYYIESPSSYYELNYDDTDIVYSDGDGHYTTKPNAIVTGHISPWDSDCYELPSTITLTNAELISYDSSTGKFAFTNITGDVIINIPYVRIATKLSMSTNMGFTLNIDGHTMYGDEAISLGNHTAEVVADEGYKFKEDSYENNVYFEGDNPRDVSLTYDFGKTIITFNFTTTSADETLHVNLTSHSPGSQSGSGSGDGNEINSNFSIENCSLTLSGAQTYNIDEYNSSEYTTIPNDSYSCTAYAKEGYHFEASGISLDLYGNGYSENIYYEITEDSTQVQFYFNTNGRTNVDISISAYLNKE